MSDERKQLPSNMFVNDAIFDIKAAINAVDVRSISALKDLTNAFNSNTKRINILQKEIASTEEDVKELSAAVEHNTQEVDKISNSQQRVLHEIQNLSRDFEGQIEKLGTNIDGKISQLRDGIEKVKDEVSKNASSGGTNIIPIMGRGGAKAATTGAAVVAKEATVASKALSGIPSLVKGLSRGIGGLIAGFAANLGEQYAEAAGMPRLGAAFGIGGDALTGAAIGGLLGSIIPVLGTAAGAWAGGALGGAYGAYDKGGQLLGGELSPQVKALQEQAQQRQEAHDREQESLKQLYKEKPELEKFPRGAGVPPEVIAEPTSGAPDTGRKTPSPIGKGIGNGYEAAGASKAEIAEYIKASAIKHGIDPNVALKVAQSEGLNKYIGDRGSSFGPFQLHYGGMAGGGMAGKGEGDNFTAKTGLDARDPSTWKAQIDYALETAKKNGWGAWHGAARVGIGPREGLNGTPSASLQQSTPQTQAPPSASIPSIAGMAGIPTSTATPQQQAESVGKTGVSETSASFIPKMEGEKGLSKQATMGNVPRGDLVALGKYLQSQGINVSEHPSFGGVLGKHATNSAHYRGQAIDVNGPPGTIEAHDPVWGKKFDELAAQLRNAGYKVIWRANGHYNHLHAQIGGESSSDTKAEGSTQRGVGQTGQIQEAPSTFSQQIPQMPQQPIPMSPIGGMGGMGAMGMNPMSMMGMMGGMGGMGRFGGMASMLTGMLGPMLGGMMGGGMPDMMSGAQLQPNQPQMAGLVPPINIEAPPINPIGMESPAEEYQQSVNNNFNIMGGSQKGVSTATPQNHLTMGARPDWLGELAEGLLGSTYTGMSRPKYFGAGTGKM